MEGGVGLDLELVPERGADGAESGGAQQDAHEEPGEPPVAAAVGEALEGADALIICTEWTKFREPDFERMQSLLKAPVIFDGRNLYSPAKLANLGFQYFHIGQKVE